ncbi:MAG: hypothetical protein WA746_25265 [Isosphaeraceae bacterium]
MPETKHPELDEIAAALQEALIRAERCQKHALTHAVEAGEWVVKAKQYLKAHPTVLQSFSDWFAVNCQGFSLRSALNYEKAYRQATANSNTCYSSINNCLKDWKKAHSPRKRFQPPTMERRELLPEAETPEFEDKAERGWR